MILITTRADTDINAGTATRLFHGQVFRTPNAGTGDTNAKNEDERNAQMADLAHREGQEISGDVVYPINPSQDPQDALGVKVPIRDPKPNLSNRGRGGPTLPGQGGHGQGENSGRISRRK